MKEQLKFCEVDTKQLLRTFVFHMKIWSLSVRLLKTKKNWKFIKNMTLDEGATQVL
jgi:hypothetical protein